MIYSSLADYCRYKDGPSFLSMAFKMAEKEGEELDLLWDDGRLFKIASDRPTPDVLNMLLEYYIKHNMGTDPESYRYKFAKQKLTEVVMNIIYSHITPTPEVMAVLEPYTFSLDDDSDSALGVEDQPETYDCEGEAGVTDGVCSDTGEVSLSGADHSLPSST